MSSGFSGGYVMIHILYYGPFKEHIKNHVELKQSVGYKYISEAEHLKRFDTFTLEKYSSATVLTKEIVLDWCRKMPYEAQANQSTRASIIRPVSYTHLRAHETRHDLVC